MTVNIGNPLANIDEETERALAGIFGECVYEANTEMGILQREYAKMKKATENKRFASGFGGFIFGERKQKTKEEEEKERQDLEQHKRDMEEKRKLYQEKCRAEQLERHRKKESDRIATQESIKQHEIKQAMDCTDPFEKSHRMQMVVRKMAEEAGADAWLAKNAIKNQDTTNFNAGISPPPPSLRDVYAYDVYTAATAMPGAI